MLAFAFDLLAGTSPGRAEALYKLGTTCMIKGGAPMRCSVECINRGFSTLDRHRIGAVTDSTRVTDLPVRVSRWVVTAKER